LNEAHPYARRGSWPLIWINRLSGAQQPQFAAMQSLVHIPRAGMLPAASPGKGTFRFGSPYFRLRTSSIYFWLCIDPRNAI
jgi:hypothetical protein